MPQLRSYFRIVSVITLLHSTMIDASGGEDAEKIAVAEDKLPAESHLRNGDTIVEYNGSRWLCEVMLNANLRPVITNCEVRDDLPPLPYCRSDGVAIATLVLGVVTLVAVLVVLAILAHALYSHMRLAAKEKREERDDGDRGRRY